MILIRILAVVRILSGQNGGVNCSQYMAGAYKLSCLTCRLATVYVQSNILLTEAQRGKRVAYIA